MNDAPMGWAGRLMQWLGFATRLVLVNVLFVVGALAGLVLFGLFPAAVAAITVLGRLRLGDAGEHVVRDFARVYRSRFWQANRAGGIFWVAGVVLFLNMLTVWAPSGGAVSSPVQAVLLVLAVAAGLGTLAAAATAVALCSRYGDPAASTWRTAFVLPLVSPLMSLSLLATLAAAVVVFSVLPVLVPLVGASLPLLLSGWLVERRLAVLEASQAAGPAAPADATPTQTEAARATTPALA
ncbi:YesL family protein [Arthrobacter sp. B6]|uniref:YesL family protein n=1 Tax=Arthrobacter sp. B6 TaxID=1570137 RepID=UPI0008301635|nr:YesL family protein [Arthrobacter sp. B6]